MARGARHPKCPPPNPGGYSYIYRELQIFYSDRLRRIYAPLCGANLREASPSPLRLSEILRQKEESRSPNLLLALFQSAGDRKEWCPPK